MTNRTILIISTYPIKGAITGGPLRVRAIKAAYEKAFTRVEHVAVFSRYHHPSGYEPSDIYVTGETEARTRFAPDTSDYIIGSAISTDLELRKAVLDKLRALKPDIIQIEQMFCWIGLRDLLPELDYRPKIVYSSHNIEWSMKRDLLTGLGYPAKDVSEMTAVLEEAETDLARRADLVVAVTDQEGAGLKALGSKSYVLARNGVHQIAATEASVDYWRAYFAKLGTDKIAIFVGSAHPPNMEGFKKMIGFGLGFVPANCRIVFAGDVGTNIFDNLDRNDVAQYTARKRMVSLGRLSQERLEGLIEFSHMILLPITEGGGSNLKTAEALVSGKKIIATSKALRSYEDFIDGDKVVVADDPDAFRGAVREQFGQPVRHFGVKRAAGVLWQNSLVALVKEVSRL